MVGIPRASWNGVRRRDLDARRRVDSRQHLVSTFQPVSGDALAFRNLVQKDVVTQMKRLQSDACCEQTQHRDLGES